MEKIDFILPKFQAFVCFPFSFRSSPYVRILAPKHDIKVNGTSMSKNLWFGFHILRLHTQDQKLLRWDKLLKYLIFRASKITAKLEIRFRKYSVINNVMEEESPNVYFSMWLFFRAFTWKIVVQIDLIWKGLWCFGFTSFRTSTTKI